MTDRFFTDPTEFQQWHSGPLGPQIADYARWLSEQRYARTTAKEYLRLLAHFSGWLEQRSAGLGALDEQRIEQFLQHRASQGRKPCHNRAILLSFLKVLRETDQLPALTPTPESNECHQLESDFARYLTQERGLSAATLSHYLPTVQCFLNERFASEGLKLEALQARDVSQFILRHTPKLSLGRAKLMVTALRSFLRFLYQRGTIPTELALAVPSVAHWRLSSLPTFLTPAQVEQVLQGCDQTTLTGQRDYTILLLLARLGLRAGEVVAMSLDDLDWRAGELTVHGKGARRERLPLPYEVGEALANYLRHTRPACATRRVFIRMSAPRRGFANSVAVCTIVRRALERAGLEPACKGAHLLRHSLATRMLHQGASLDEIGEILRHQSVLTTQLYAKVDARSLSPLAQPWPGGEA